MEQFWDINIDVAFRISAELCPTEKSAREAIAVVLNAISRLSPALLSVEPTEVLFVGAPTDEGADEGDE